MPLRAGHYAEGAEALLVALALKGDVRAFEELTRRRQSWIRQLLRRCCLDEHLADDLAQEVFLTAWRKLRQLQEPDRLAGWLQRIAITTWLQHQRRAQLPTGPVVVEELPAADRRPDVARDLDRALATLPADQRLCVVLSYHEGHSHNEISQMTELPLGTVKSHIARGSAALREHLASYRSRT